MESNTPPTTATLSDRHAPHAHHYSPLLNLPRELRNRIWDFALEEIEIHIRKHDHGIVIAYPDPNQHQHRTSSTAKTPAPRWLVACKQLFSEGLTQFDKEGVCTRITHHTKLPKRWLSRNLYFCKDSIFLSRTRRLSLSLPFNVDSHDFSEPHGGTVITISTISEEMGFPDVLLPTRGKMDIKDFLPNLEDLHLRITVAGLQHHARPKQISINAGTLRALGTHWKRVHISILMPELFLVHLTTDSEDVKVPYIASLADTYPRFQKALVQLGDHLTRRLGTFQPPKRTEEPWAYEAREARCWFVSEHTMHSCLEYESDAATELQTWFDVKDSIDAAQLNVCGVM
jgi:hypothetical protein